MKTRRIKSALIYTFIFILLVFAVIGCMGVYSKNKVLNQPLKYDEYELSSGENIQVYTIDLLASNAYLIVSEAGMILVDAGMPYMAPVIVNYINKVGRTDLNLIYITHSHIDHFGSAAELSRIYDAPVAIHIDDADFISQGNTDLGIIRKWYLFSEKVLPFIEPLLSVEPTKPDILFYGGENLDEFGIPEAQIIHLPGHTPGQSALILDGRIGFVGDNLSSQGKDHIQKSYAHSWEDLQNSIEKLKGLNIDFYYAGHGEDVITQEEFQELNY